MVTVSLLLAFALTFVAVILHPRREPVIHVYAAMILCTGLSLRLGSLSVGVEFLSLALVPLVFRRLDRRRDARSNVTGWAFALSWVVVAVTSAARHAPDSVASIWIASHIFSAMLVGIAMTSRDLRPLIDAVLNVGSLIAAWSIAVYVANTLGIAAPEWMRGVGPDGRLIGFSLETNLFASQCVLILLLGAVTSQLRRARANVLRLGTLSMATLLAGTRAAWVVLALIAALLIVNFVRRWRLAVPVLSAGIPTVAVGTIAFIESTNDGSTNSLYWRSTHLFETQTGTGAYRLDIYARAIAEIDSPVEWILGFGVNVYGQFHPVDATNSSAEYLSSIWVASLYETGLVGSICMAAVLFFVAARANSWRGWAMLGATLVCATTTNLYWFQYAWVLIAMTGLAELAVKPRSTDSNVKEAIAR